METSEDVKSIESVAKTLLQEDKLRFIGIINRMGRVIVKQYREGVTSLLKDQEDQMLSMQLALEIFLREEFDEKLGPIDYVLSKRQKVNLISIPIGKYLVLVSTNPGVNVDTIAAKTTDIFRNLLS